MFQENKCSNNLGHGSHLCALFTEIACRIPYVVFLGKFPARGVHRIALDESVATFRSQNWRNLKSKQFEINDNNSDLYLDTLQSMNYENNKTNLLYF